MRKLICAALLFTAAYGIAQSENDLWKKSTAKESSARIQSHLPQKNIFDLNVLTLKKILSKTPKRETSGFTSKVIISLPNGEGKIEKFSVYDNAVMAPELAAKYPDIKSYVAVGIDNPLARAYFSFSPLGLKSMTLYPNHSAVFIEPVSNDLTTYTVYKKKDRHDDLGKFECGVIDQTMKSIPSTSTNNSLARGADDAKLRTFRLALAATGEYAAYFGGSKAATLASMNNTLTRINGIFEKDFGVRLVLIPNNDMLIYTNASTDPFSDYLNKVNWKTEAQANFTAVIGEANYDIGHLLGAGVANSGDAGARGSICEDNYKGRAYTCAYSGNYQGDAFDLDFVAHEMGHQLGANHTFTYINEGTAAQLEPGSGSTIMSYAGRTSKDIEFRADAYFHAISIQQVTDLIKTKTCPTITSTGNAVPVVNAGLDYTIPKGTPFMLTGLATDANTTDALTYSWEQMDAGTATTSVPSTTATAGPLFRSYPASSSATRYFPAMTSVLTGSTTTSGKEILSEALPGVARTLNFRLTVRDNRIGGGSNNADDMIVTVDGTAGPFTVDTQNTAVSYAAGTSQTISWTVAGTNANTINCTNVDILLSTDGGQTFPITLVAGTPNDGTQSVVIPNNPGTTNRIMVKGSGHIFFDVNNANFTITGSAATDTSAPTTSTLSASGTTTSSTNLSWTTATDNTSVTGYNVYQNGILKTTTTATSLAVTGLAAATTYNFYVTAKDAAGNVSTASNTINITTLAPADSAAPSTATLTASGTTVSSTNLSWTAATDNTGVTGYNVYQNGVLKTTTTTTSLAVTGLAATTTYNFYVTAKDAAGNVSAASNTVNVTTLSLADTTAPVAPSLSASGITASSVTLTWTAATDNIGVIGYNIYQNGTLKTTTTTTSLAVTGLAAATNYNFYVTAKDAAGNVSTASNTISPTTLSTGIQYCNSNGGTNKEYINRVQIGTINNLSGNNNGYGNYTMQSTNLMTNTTATIVITPGWNGMSANEAYCVWIDYNQDGIFGSNELVFSKSKTKSATVNGSFTIPAAALSGATRMRVSMKYNAFPTACETYSNGEVEDYTVTILQGATAKPDIYEELATTEKTTNKFDFKLYPNPVKGETVYLSDLEGSISYRIYTMAGQQVANGNTETNSINVGTLKSGIYIIEVSNGISVGSKRFIKN